MYKRLRICEYLLSYFIRNRAGSAWHGFDVPGTVDIETGGAALAAHGQSTSNQINPNNSQKFMDIPYIHIAFWGLCFPSSYILTLF